MVADMEEEWGRAKYRQQRLRLLAGQAAGLRYDSAEANTILDQEDWSQYWPACDSYGLLTGDIVREDEEGYLIVGEEAMVRADAPGVTEGAEDGYAVLPPLPAAGRAIGGR